MSRITKTNEKLKSQKRSVCYRLENEFSTFSTLDVLGNEFSTLQLDMLTLHIDVNSHSTLPVQATGTRKPTSQSKTLNI